MAELSMGDMLSLVGDELDDETAAKERFRDFLLNPKWGPDEFETWIQECLNQAGGENANWTRALQDAVVAVGGHLGFEVEFGRYEDSGPEEATFDGLWRRAMGEAILIEVIASTTSTTSVDGLGASLRRCEELRGAGQNSVSGLCVVGNAAPNLMVSLAGDNQHNDWLSFITVKDLISLWRLKIDLEDMVGRLLGPSSNRLFSLL